MQYTRRNGSPRGIVDDSFQVSAFPVSQPAQRHRTTLPVSPTLWLLLTLSVSLSLQPQPPVLTYSCLLYQLRTRPQTLNGRLRPGYVHRRRLLVSARP